ncbi:MAG: hypothetical protein M1546_24540 [Chloroflexi bacterium]|nr:hypothetical protein [Chloroflexota bacterium]
MYRGDVGALDGEGVGRGKAEFAGEQRNRRVLDRVTKFAEQMQQRARIFAEMNVLKYHVPF